MESIIEEIVEEICYLSSVHALQKDIYLDNLVEYMFKYADYLK